MPRTAEPPRPRAHVRDRRRLRRARHRDQAPGGRRARLPGRRARPGRRRHLARQHLPRRRLRRPLAALLVLVRAQPGLDPVLLPAAGDPGLHPRRRRALRGARPVPLRDLRQEARWDDDALVWRVRTSRGELTADLLVSAAGALSDPKMPDIDGIDSFDGEVFHSAQWPEDADLAGKRVAVIGTGASAIQIVPAIAEEVEHLDGVPAHRAVRRPAPGPRVHQGRAARLQAPARRPADLPHRRLLEPRGAGARLRARAEARHRAREGGARQHPPRPAHQARAARQGPTPTSGSAASGS